MERQGAITARNDAILRMVMLDFAAILLGYNLPPDEARRVASQAVQPVREHFLTTGALLRLKRFSKGDGRSITGEFIGGD